MNETEKVGNAFKIILKRLQEDNNIKIEEKNLPHTCNNCKYCHGIEGYNQEWGTTYCVQSWCDKDINLMDSIKKNNDHYIIPCDYFEAGKGKYDKINERK